MSYMIAVDCGGSKTLYALFNMNGELLNYFRGQGASPCLANEEELASVLISDFKKLCTDFKIDLSDISYIFGVFMLHDKLNFSRAIKRSFPNCDVTFYDEHPMNVYSSLGKETGIIVHSGTGSFVCAKWDKGEVVYGGMGSYIGDEGSGFSIGLRALQASIYAIDGRGEPTILTELIFDLWRISHKDTMSDVWALATDVVRVNAESRKKICQLAAVASIAAQKNDQIAIRIFENAAWEMYKQVGVLIEKFNTPKDLEFSISGSVWNSGDVMLKPFLKFVFEKYPDLKYIYPKYIPVIGCMRKKLNELNILDEAQIEFNMLKANKTIIDNHTNTLKDTVIDSQEHTNK